MEQGTGVACSGSLTKTENFTGLSKQTSATLHELATELGVSSRNLADIFGQPCT